MIICFILITKQLFLYGQCKENSHASKLAGTKRDKIRNVSKVFHPSGPFLGSFEYGGAGTFTPSHSPVQLIN